jgi:hypothetical protein
MMRRVVVLGAAMSVVLIPQDGNVPSPKLVEVVEPCYGYHNVVSRPDRLGLRNMAFKEEEKGKSNFPVVEVVTLRTMTMPWLGSLQKLLHGRNEDNSAVTVKRMPGDDDLIKHLRPYYGGKLRQNNHSLLLSIHRRKFGPVLGTIRQAYNIRTLLITMPYD